MSYQVIPWQMGIVAKAMRLLPNWLYDRLAITAPRKPRDAMPFHSGVPSPNASMLLFK